MTADVPSVSPVIVNGSEPREVALGPVSSFVPATATLQNAHWIEAQNVRGSNVSSSTVLRL